MHSAPSVSYPVGRSRSAAVLLLGLWLLGAGIIGLWWLQGRPSGGRLGAVSVMLAFSGLMAAWQWWRSPCGILAWEGDGWRWSSGRPIQAGGVSVSLDLQGWLLLRWTGDGPGHWLWLERTRDQSRWDDLRRAVYSRARPEAAQGAPGPAAKT